MALKHYVPLDPNARYIVRNERWEDGKIWGVDLSLQEAMRRKELIAGRQISRTPMFEVMPTNEDLVHACVRVYNERCIALALEKAVVLPPYAPAAVEAIAVAPPPPIPAAAWTGDQAALAALNTAAEVARVAQATAPGAVHKVATDADSLRAAQLAVDLTPARAQYGAPAPMQPGVVQVASGEGIELTEDEMAEIEALESMSLDDLVGDPAA